MKFPKVIRLVFFINSYSETLWVTNLNGYPTFLSSPRFCPIFPSSLIHDPTRDDFEIFPRNGSLGSQFRLELKHAFLRPRSAHHFLPRILPTFYHPFPPSTLPLIRQVSLVAVYPSLAHQLNENRNVRHEVAGYFRFVRLQICHRHQPPLVLGAPYCSAGIDFCLPRNWTKPPRRLNLDENDSRSTSGQGVGAIQM